MPLSDKVAAKAEVKMMLPTFNSAVLAVALVLTGAAGSAMAQGTADACHVSARQQSGYRGARPVIGTFGGVTMRLSGSASVGVTHNSGPNLRQKSPPWAGSAARERREKKGLDLYLQAYDRCMSGG